MKLFIYALRRNWPLAIPILYAVAYGVVQKTIDGSATTPAPASVLMLELVSDARLQLFVVLPTWLIGTGIGALRARKSQELLRYGSWRATILKPLRVGLSRFAIVAFVVLFLWSVLLIESYGRDSLSSIVSAAIAVMTEIVLTSFTLSCLYFIVTIVHLLARSAASIVAISAVIWAWASLANTGAIPPNSLANISLYMSVGAVFSVPLIAGSLLLMTVASLAGAWRLAAHLDQSRLNAASYAITIRGVGLIAALCFVALGVVGIGSHSDPSTKALSSVFYGTGGTVIQYLLGMTLLVLFTLGAVTEFSSDWHRRSGLLVLRHGTLYRWMRSILSREALLLFGYVCILVSCTFALRYVLGTAGKQAWPSVIGEALLTSFKLYFAGIFFVAIGMIVVTLFRSEVAGAVALAVLVGLGLLPINRWPGSPFTAWSMSWVGQQNVVACISLVCAALFTVFLLFVVNRNREGEWCHNADR